MEFTGERMIPKINEGEVIWAEHYARYIFASQFVRNKTVLDVSCGSGYGACFLGEGGAKKVVGVDISKETIQYAKRNYSHPKVEYRVGDAQNLQFKDESFDVIVSFEIIEHLPDYKKFLRGVKRVLRKDGIFICSTPNKRAHPPGNEFHIHEFELGEFESDLREQFRNIKFLYQDNWITSGVLEPKVVASESFYKQVGGVDLFKIFGKDYKNSLYFVALCADKPIHKTFTGTAALYAFAVGANEWMRKQRVAEERLQKQILCLTTELGNIYRSRAWKLATFLQRIKHFLSPPKSHEDNRRFKKGSCDVS